MGRIYVFFVIDVVPEPGRPETGKALKLFAKEEVRGAVTALGGVGSQGFLMVAMGQKVMVRGLKEDGTLLPTAFVDVQCYVSVVRELGAVREGSAEGVGLCLLGDAVKGVWLTGYMVCFIFFLFGFSYKMKMSSFSRRSMADSVHNQQEEPYQLQLFSKSPYPIETICAEFLPDGSHLYIVVADASCNLHILQFDPDSTSTILPSLFTLFPSSPMPS